VTTPESHGERKPTVGIVRAAAAVVGANHMAWRRWQERGLPPWALVAVALVSIVGIAGAVALYFTAHSLAVSAVLIGVTWLVDVFIFTAVDSIRSAKERGR
jgi:uncharacterized membrane protein